MNRFHNRRLYYVVLVLGTIGGVIAVLQFLGWSVIPFGKRYVANYYFSDLHAHHTNYFPLGKRLIILNGEPVDSIRPRHIVGIAKASRIVEYSSTAAIERFGASAQYGATEIIGTDAEWLISKEPNGRPNWNPA